MNRDLLIEDIHRLMDGELVELPVYDFKAGGVGGYKPMQGDKDAVIIAEGIHMLNPLIFDQLRSEATGVYVARVRASSRTRTASFVPSSCAWRAA